MTYKKNSPVSNLTTTTQVDTDSNNYDDTQSVATPIKHNPSTPVIHETTTITTTNNSVQATANLRICQMSSSTSTASLTPPPPI